MPSWDEYFMRHAYLASSKSKDTRTKIGAVLVRDKRIISEGYNGMPMKVDDFPQSRYERPEKYFWFEHGERNACYCCARHGISTLGAVMYTQGIPCADCGRAVIQCGVTEVIVHKQWQEFERQFYWEKWLESSKRTESMFQEAGVTIRVFDQVLDIQSILDGKAVYV
jgi:dCMP deaminase